MNVNLRIERLIVEGMAITPAQRALLGAAVESELARLLRAGGLSTSLLHGIAVPSLDATFARFDAPFDPLQAGGQIASAIYARIGSGGAP